MKKLNELKTISKIVKEALEESPEARNDDCLLYVIVCGRINPDVYSSGFAEVMANRAFLKIPAPETVRRSRQKIQAEFPELSGTKDCQKARKEFETDFREFARCDNG